eukprot:365802-Chlamydomonas_euryale.AAC.3
MSGLVGCTLEPPHSCKQMSGQRTLSGKRISLGSRLLTDQTYLSGGLGGIPPCARPSAPCAFELGFRVGSAS